MARPVTSWFASAGAFVAGAAVGACVGVVWGSGAGNAGVVEGAGAGGSIDGAVGRVVAVGDAGACARARVALAKTLPTISSIAAMASRRHARFFQRFMG